MYIYTTKFLVSKNFVDRCVGNSANKSKKRGHKWIFANTICTSAESLFLSTQEPSWAKTSIFTYTWCVDIESSLPIQQPSWVEINFCTCTIHWQIVFFSYPKVNVNRSFIFAPHTKHHYRSITANVYYAWPSCISNNAKKCK